MPPGMEAAAGLPQPRARCGKPTLRRALLGLPSRKPSLGRSPPTTRPATPTKLRQAERCAASNGSNLPRNVPGAEIASEEEQIGNAHDDLKPDALRLPENESFPKANDTRNPEKLAGNHRYEEG